MKFIFGLVLCLIGCVEAQTEEPKPPENKFVIVCYSGGEKVYSGFTSNYYMSYSDWRFVDNETGYEIETNAQCLAAKIK